METFKKDKNGVFHNQDSSGLLQRKQFHILLKRIISIENKLKQLESK